MKMKQLVTTTATPALINTTMLDQSYIVDNAREFSSYLIYLCIKKT
jgi:hypothetical protein